MSTSASASASTSTNPPSTTPSIPSPTNPPPTHHGPSQAPSHSVSSTSPSTLPHSPETLRQIAEARTALEASMTNIGTTLSSQLSARAVNLHSNSAALEKQEKDLVKATAGLRKEGDKLEKMAGEGQRKVKELGNVQNWAEMLERDFLVLEETLRLVNRRGEGEESDGSGSWSGSSWSGSEVGDGERDAESIRGDMRRGQVKGDGVAEGVESRTVDGEGDTAMEGMEERHGDKGKGKVEVTGADQPSEGHREPQAETQSEQTEVIGGSSTTTIGSSSEPSSSSVHTSASVAS